MPPSYARLACVATRHAAGTGASASKPREVPSERSDQCLDGHGGAGGAASPAWRKSRGESMSCGRERRGAVVGGNAALSGCLENAARVDQEEGASGRAAQQKQGDEAPKCLPHQRRCSARRAARRSHALREQQVHGDKESKAKGSGDEANRSAQELQGEVDLRRNGSDEDRAT